MFEVRSVNLGGKLEALEGKEGTAKFVEGKCNCAGVDRFGENFHGRMISQAKMSVFTVSSLRVSEFSLTVMAWTRDWWPVE